MPDHFHLLLTVGPEISIERTMQFIEGRFSFRRLRELGLTSPVWRRGFSETRVLDYEAFVKILITSGAIRSDDISRRRPRNLRTAQQIENSNWMRCRRG
jgi:REP element-mobilizing transposase RayT